MLSSLNLYILYYILISYLYNFFKICIIKIVDLKIENCNKNAANVYIFVNFFIVT